MDLIAWIVVGLIVGVIARVIMPGPDPGGFIVTVLLGIAGAFVGGMIGRTAGWYAPGQPAGWILSVVGAMLLLWGYRMATGRR